MPTNSMSLMLNIFHVTVVNFDELPQDKIDQVQLFSRPAWLRSIVENSAVSANAMYEATVSMHRRLR